MTFASQKDIKAMQTGIDNFNLAASEK